MTLLNRDNVLFVLPIVILTILQQDKTEKTSWTDWN
jgi:hypothetical protein